MDIPPILLRLFSGFETLVRLDQFDPEEFTVMCNFSANN